MNKRKEAWLAFWVTLVMILLVVVAGVYFMERMRANVPKLISLYGTSNGSPELLEKMLVANIRCIYLLLGGLVLFSGASFFIGRKLAQTARKESSLAEPQGREVS